jgi:hypothetical protein
MILIYRAASGAPTDVRAPFIGASSCRPAALLQGSEVVGAPFTGASC